jgi:tRNA(Ile)-lysidine synthase
VVLDRDEICFLLDPSEKTLGFEYEIPHTQTTLIPEIGISLKLSACNRSEVADLKTHPATTALFDAARVTFPLQVRNFRQGDRFNPLGMAGSQKVKTFFINHKVPRSQRLLCPILVSGGRIIWVGGYRIDDSAKVTQKTKKVLKAELLPASMINKD